MPSNELVELVMNFTFRNVSVKRLYSHFRSARGVLSCNHQYQFLHFPKRSDYKWPSAKKKSMQYIKILKIEILRDIFFARMPIGHSLLLFS